MRAPAGPVTSGIDAAISLCHVSPVPISPYHGFLFPGRMNYASSIANGTRVFVLDCKNCTERGLKCRGFGVNLRWPAELTRRNSKTNHKYQDTNANKTQLISGEHNYPVKLPTLSASVSSLALPAEDSFFMQHYLRMY